jgi:hypothetical protein
MWYFPAFSNKKADVYLITVLDVISKSHLNQLRKTFTLILNGQYWSSNYTIDQCWVGWYPH